MKNKKVLGVIIAVVGAVVSIFAFIKAVTLSVDIPISSSYSELEYLMLQFQESSMLIPFISGLILMIVGLIIVFKEVAKKKK